MAKVAFGAPVKYVAVLLVNMFSMAALPAYVVTLCDTDRFYAAAL